ncbi:MAG TPA: ABC transporter permease [Candidatus Angelobacter sp.]|nr:ABC transporter permease [Candidatus Angelobacter sp.]
MWQELFKDVRYGARLLLRSRGFALTAVLMLALGVGATTAIFSLLDPLLLRKLPVDHPEELVALATSGTMGTANEWQSGTIDRFRSEKRVFAGVLAFAPLNTEEFVHDNRPHTARGLLVSGNYFNVLGVRPYMGSLLTPDDDSGAYGSNNVVLSYDYWQREFRGSQGVVGKMVPIRDMSLIVAGITPPQFFGAVIGEKPDFYVPLKMGRPLKGEGTEIPGDWVTIMGRLQPGLSAAQAQVALEPMFEQLASESGIPEVERRQMMARLRVLPAERGISKIREKLLLPARLLMAISGLVLLIACFNVANLLLARAAARRHEIEIRLALGAGRWRTVRHILTESALLTAAATLAALGLAYCVNRILVAALNRQAHAFLSAGLNLRVLLFALAIASLTTLLCGLAPALAATRRNPNLRPGTLTATPRRLGNAFVLGQVTLSVAALIAAGLLLHSLINLETTKVGFDRDQVLTATLSGNIYGNTPARIAGFYHQLLTKAGALPGVRAVSLSSFPPISGRMFGINVAVEGYTPEPSEELHAFFNSVTPDYFATMGIPLLQGRDFSSSQDVEGAPLVGIINRTMARHFFGDESPIGKHFQMIPGGSRGPIEIVGVAGDSRYNDVREKTPDFFYLCKSESAPGWAVNATLNVRSAIDPEKALATPLRDIVASLDNEVSITSMKTLRERVDESLLQDRLITALCGAFSLLALSLACIGLYGVLALNVARRSGEIGVRMALGATRGRIFRRVLGEGMRLVFVGLALGAASGLACAGFLRRLLYGVELADPATLGGICLLLLVAGLLACYLPARRATSVDPMIALRNE